MACKFIVEAGEQTQLCSDGVGVESAGGLGCWQPAGGNKGNKCLSGEGAKREKQKSGERVLKGRRRHPSHSTCGAAGARALWEALHCIPGWHGSQGCCPVSDPCSHGPVLLRGSFFKLLEFP